MFNDRLLDFKTGDCEHTSILLPLLLPLVKPQFFSRITSLVFIISFFLRLLT